MAKKPPAPGSKPQVAAIVKLLHQTYDDADTALDWRTPLELLIATILSAQCTDMRVNAVTKELFKKYRKPADYVAVDVEELRDDIRSINFYRNKASMIQRTCRILIDQHGGKVPRTMEELTALPGVARKTANVVLGTAFDIAVGVVVDTHVRRVSYRLGWTEETDPPKIEADLMKLLPQDEWIFGGHALIWHGRQICHARAPQCPVCPLRELCPKRGVV